MRQGNYDQLKPHCRTRPDRSKFWNARFNLAEIPFLKKDWPQARKRFEQLLSPDLAKESYADDPIQNFFDLPDRGQREHGRFHAGQVRASTDTPVVDYVRQPSRSNRRIKMKRKIGSTQQRRISRRN